MFRINNWISFFIIISFSLANLPGQDTIFIDPLMYEKEEGHFNSGLIVTSWNEITFKEGNIYLQRSGTIDTVDHISVGASNVHLGRYGSGDKPVIVFKTRENQHGISIWNKESVRVSGIEIVAPEATSGIYMNEENSNCIIDSCTVRESNWGIRVTSGNNTSHKILYNEIYNIVEDGIFIQDAKFIEIGYNYIHHVNANWKSPESTEKEAAGDGIQLSRCNNWHVHHNIIDRRKSGNKFCFIANSPDQNNGILEKNIMYSPDYKGSCVFLGSGSGIIIRYNQFWGNRNANGIYHHVENLSIYYNTFSRFRNGIVSYHDSTCLVLNNTFYACNYAIQGTNIKSINNIFDNKTGLHVPYHEVKKLDNKNNHYTSGYPGKLSTKGDPGFVNGEKGNFRLTPGSPCINKGMPNDIPFDLFGNKVPSGTLPDIGACEFERKPP